MLTKEERAAIRARCDVASRRQLLVRKSEIDLALADIPMLLDALDEADHKIPVDDYMKVVKDKENAAFDRDYWKMKYLQMQTRAEKAEDRYTFLEGCFDIQTEALEKGGNTHNRLMARREALEAELNELRAESQHWETDCSTCPLSDFELCHEICHTKKRLLSFAANATKIYDRWKARCEALERAIYTATWNKWDGDLRCLFCQFGPEGTCAQIVERGNPNTGYDMDWDCEQCDGTDDKRGGWQFDEARFGKEQSDE